MKIEIFETDYQDLYNGNLLYKYVDWSDIPRRKILTNLEVYYSSLEEFGTDENHVFRTNLEKISESKLKILATEILKAEGNYQSIHNKNDVIDVMIANYSNNIEEWIKSDREERRSSLGILSLSAKRDIPEMWTMFAEDFKGICIGFDSEEFFIQAKPSGGGLINYFDETPVLEPPFFDADSDIASMLLEINSLPSYFKNEEEYRLFRTRVPGSFLRKQQLKPNVYKEIILGSAIQANHKQTILNLLKDKLPHIVILEARYDRNEKTVEIKELE